MEIVVELLAPVIQFLVQFVVEVVVEALVELGIKSAKHLRLSGAVRQVVAVLLGVGFGVAWGRHLQTGAVPKLLWVSLALAGAAAAIVFLRREGPITADRDTWRWLRTWPWRWSRERLFDFVVLNLAIAAGIAIGYFVA